MTKTSSPALTAGVDVSKARLDTALPGDRTWAGPNAPAGHAALVAQLRKAGVTRVGLEASGGYERALAGALREAGFEVLVLQPLQVRAYARFRLKRAKTDAIDASLIAACAASLEAARPAPDPRLAATAEHLTLIEADRGGSRPRQDPSRTSARPAPARDDARRDQAPVRLAPRRAAPARECLATAP